MADARTITPFKGGKSDSIVASGGVLRRTGFEGSVGASAVNPDCPIRKKEEHNKCVIENTVMKGKLANNEEHIQQLKEKNLVPHGNEFTHDSPAQQC